MTDHPSTFHGDAGDNTGIDWDDRAALHATGDGDGVLDSAKGLRSGSFAELIRYVMTLPAESRAKYYIEKAGDREYHADEIAVLARRNDFPATG